MFRFKKKGCNLSENDKEKLMDFVNLGLPEYFTAQHNEEDNVESIVVYLISASKKSLNGKRKNKIILTSNDIEEMKNHISRNYPNDNGAFDYLDKCIRVYVIIRKYYNCKGDLIKLPYNALSSNEHYYIGTCCQFCNKGSFEIVTKLDTKQLFVRCNECHRLYNSPIDVFNENVPINIRHNIPVRPSTIEEIRKQGWEIYLI